MDQENRCPQCGADLAADVPQGLCPACLLKRGLETQTGGGEGSKPGSAAYVPPTPAELAPHFPDLEILELVGRGGMGVVYKARQKHLNRLVALKILSPSVGKDPAFADRFAREAQAMAMLSHPHIVAVHDFGQAGGLYYFLMELVDGLNLRRLLDTTKLAPKEALAIVPQICDALQYAHDKGVVHRDIKPENVLMSKEGQVKIADFGLAKLMGKEAKDFTLTGAGQVMGTPNYMAPEQIEHPQDVDHRADIYSLGVVFYQMLTGELPLGRFAPPSRRVQIDVRLDEVVLRALEKEPDLRYQQASEVRTEVETIAATASQAQASSGAGEDRPPAAPRRSIQPLPEARFSRAAIIGAAWAPLFFITALTWFTARVVQVTPGSPPPGPEWWQWVLLFTLLPLGLAAPFGTTILGWVAVAQIRRSLGRLYGLGLAVFDGFLFPLLLLDALIFWTWDFLFTVIQQALPQSGGRPVTHEIAPGIGGAPNMTMVVEHPTLLSRLLREHRPELLFLFGLATVVIVDWLILRAVWRAVRKPVGEARQPVKAGSVAERPQPNGSTAVFAWIALALFLAGPLGGAIIAAFATGDSSAIFVLTSEAFALIIGCAGWRHRAGKVAVWGAIGLLVVGVTLGIVSYERNQAARRDAMQRMQILQQQAVAQQEYNVRMAREAESRLKRSRDSVANAEPLKADISHSTYLSPVDAEPNHAVNVLRLEPDRCQSWPLSRGDYGLPARATPEQVAAKAGIGDLYLTIGKQPKGTTPMATLAPLREATLFPIDGVGRMTGEQIAAAGDAFLSAHDWTASTRTTAAEGQACALVRPDGYTYVLKIGELSQTAGDETHRQLEITMYPFGKIPWGASFHVVDTQGKPVAGATATFAVTERASKARGLATYRERQLGALHGDANSSIPLPPLPHGAQFRGKISAPGFCLRNDLSGFRNDDGNYVLPGDEGAVLLKRPGAIEGRVLGPDGKPLVHAPLSLDTRVEYPRSSTLTANALRAISDDQGRFRFEEVPPGNHVLCYPWFGPTQGDVDSGRWNAYGTKKNGCIIVPLPLTGYGMVRPIKVDEGATAKDVLLDFSQSTAAIEGKVLDAAGKPVKGAEVSLAWSRGDGKNWDGLDLPPIVTDAAGYYRIEHLPAGLYQLHAIPPGMRVAPENSPAPIQASPAAKQALHVDLRISVTVVPGAQARPKPIPPEAIAAFFAEVDLVQSFLAVRMRSRESLTTDFVPWTDEEKRKIEEADNKFLALVKGTEAEQSAERARKTSDALTEVLEDEELRKDAERLQKAGAEAAVADFHLEWLILKAGAPAGIREKAAGLGFGPWREVILPAQGTGGACAVNFDTGTTYTLPLDVAKEVPDLPHWQMKTGKKTSLIRWVAQTGVDAVAVDSSTLLMLCNVIDEAEIADPAINRQWDAQLTPQWLLWKLDQQEKLRARVRPGPVGPLEAINPFTSAAANTGSIGLFRTHAGGSGVLQIVGSSEKPSGVKIRYKLLQNIAGHNQASH